MFTRQRVSFSNLLAPLIAAIVGVLGICSALYLREADQIASNALDRESRRMEIFTGLFNRDVDSAVTDLRLLVSGDGLQAYLHTGRPADFDRAIRRAVFFSKEHPVYDKVRYLDEQGREVIRINANGVVVP